MTSVETFYNCQNILGEGIIWSQQNNSLYWLDIPMPSKLYKCSFNENKFETLICLKHYCTSREISQ